MTLTNTIIQNLRGKDGGAFYMKEKVTVTFNDISVSSIQVSNNGGLIFAIEETKYIRCLNFHLILSNPATSSLIKFVDTNLATMSFQDI